jgi:hypothetical protein
LVQVRQQLVPVPAGPRQPRHLEAQHGPVTDLAWTIGRRVLASLMPSDHSAPGEPLAEATESILEGRPVEHQRGITHAASIS